VTHLRAAREDGCCGKEEKGGGGPDDKVRCFGHLSAIVGECTAHCSADVHYITSYTTGAEAKREFRGPLKKNGKR